MITRTINGYKLQVIENKPTGQFYGIITDPKGKTCATTPYKNDEPSAEAAGEETIAEYIRLTQAIIDGLPKLPISAIALLIRKDWGKVYFGAVPYLSAMLGLSSVNDNYGADSARSIVNYFLANATTWKGPLARAVKTELNKRVKGK
jgi:hypothetical protein